MKLAVYQMEVVTAEPQQNLTKLRETLRQHEADIYVLPELWSTGFCNKQFQQLASTTEDIEAEVANLSQEFNCTIMGSTIKQTNQGITNHFTAYNRGKCELQYDKIHLFSLLREERYLVAGQRMGFCKSEQNGHYGVGICYDLRFPEMFRSLAINGAHCIFLPSQWPMERVDHFRALCVARAIENQFFFISCNNVGMLGEKMKFAGHSMVVDPWGKVLSEGSGDQEEVLLVTINPEQSQQVREKITVLDDRRQELYQL
ncbi:nitrilase-related carbon-nitrogen hydrolase [Desulfurispira natronophila]|uniref:Putative amidohydrolase n=1 Tax=Desulfurispira natronophila TaxID=682562 RepID=A0A7W8DG21_9BACT|nr:nitrilase-related carbon-nitrogen hydrolase [Desulfurispira natronophila]MBB5020972.1 putative amidohydrolase [Desulfurispira natronophila]